MTGIAPLPHLVLFDLDGTLAATAPDIANAINLLLVEEGVPPIAETEAHAYVGSGTGAEHLIAHGFRLAGRSLSDEERAVLLARYFALYLDNLCIRSALYEGCATALDALIAEGHVLAVCTNKPTRHARGVLEQLQVADRFAAICGRDAFAAYKPDRRHIEGTVAAAGAGDRPVVLVGDSETDVMAAKAAGIPVVLVDFGYGAEKARALGPDAVVGHYGDLLGTIRGLIRRPAA